ncbi:hypothetical protein DOY81_015411, partial [Sarcophaga bullata]
MFTTLKNYLSNVHRAWTNGDGDQLASFISLKDKHIMNRNLYVQNPENAVGRILESPIDEIICAHLKVLYYLWLEPKDFMQAYKHQSQCIQS